MEFPDIQKAIAQAIVRVQIRSTIITKMSIMLSSDATCHAAQESLVAGP